MTATLSEAPAIPDLKAVDSSNISHLGHDGSDTWIRFKSGGLYRYSGVPAQVHQDFVAADSKGSFFRQHLAGKYKHSKVY